jgi:hypothetical protein
MNALKGFGVFLAIPKIVRKIVASYLFYFYICNVQLNMRRRVTILDIVRRIRLT